MESPSWLLLKTKPSRERYAQQNVEHWAGLETYLPLFNDAGKERVLFPSYLFVLSDQWWFLKGAWGVSHVVMVGSEPAKVSQGVIDGLRKRQHSDGLIHLPKASFQQDQPLAIQDGPFEKRIGLFQGMDGHQRVRVLLDLLGGKYPVSVPLSAVTPL
jgi:transcriptional antiterminator RfaH